MRDRFERATTETRAERERAQREQLEALEKQAEYMEKLRQKPEEPALKPTGKLRELGDEEGRKVEREKYDSVQEQIAKIKEERALRAKEREQNQDKGKSL